MRRWYRRPLAAALVLGLVTAAVLFASFVEYYRATGQPWTLRGDNLTIQFPVAFEGYRALRELRLPDWTPRMFGGFPLGAEAIGGPMYLPHLLAFWLTPSPHWLAYDLSTAWHAGLLAAGGVFLLSRLDAGVLGAVLGGLLLLSAPFTHFWAVRLLPQYAAVCWWPWLFGAAEMLGRRETSAWGRYAWLGWLALGGQIMAGYPEFAIYSGLVAAGWILFCGQRIGLIGRMARVALLALGGLALGAPQILASMGVLAQSMRGFEQPEAYGAVLSLEWKSIIWTRWALPTKGQKLGYKFGYWPAFVGFGSTALALWALCVPSRHVRYLAAVAVTSFLLTFGPRTPLYPLLQHVPPFSLFRGPIKFWEVFEVSSTVLAALGSAALLRTAAHTSRPRLATALVVALVGGAIVERAAFTLMRVEGYPYQRRPLPGIVEVFSHSGLPERVAGAVDGGRMAGISGGSINVVWGIDSLGGGPAQMLGGLHPQVLGTVRERALLDLIGARWLISSGRACRMPKEVSGLELVASDAKVCLLRNPTAGARFAFIDRFRPVADLEAMVDSTRRDPSVVSVLVEPPEVLPMDGGGPGVVRVIEQGPGWAHLATENDHTNLLLVRESWAPGWQAWVDGAPAALYRAAGIFFAVPVPAGAHQVELRYRLPGLRPGLAIAFAWVVFALLVRVAASKRSSKALDDRVIDQHPFRAGGSG